jgi:hypothetical protein
VKIKMGESKFGAPLGPPYAAEFAQVEEVDAKPGTDYGPGWRWQFRIAEGEHAGKLVSRTTSREPSAKNACGKMLAAVTGKHLAVNEEVDLAGYVGRRYLVTMEPDFTGKGTRVGTVVAYPAANGTAAGPLPAVKAPPPPPPPPQPKAGPAEFWYQPRAGENVELGTETEIQTWIDANNLDPAKVQVMAESEGEWKPAAAFGFTAKAPF